MRCNSHPKRSRCRSATRCAGTIHRCWSTASPTCPQRRSTYRCYPARRRQAFQLRSFGPWRGLRAPLYRARYLPLFLHSPRGSGHGGHGGSQAKRLICGLLSQRLTGMRNHPASNRCADRASVWIAPLHRKAGQAQARGPASLPQNAMVDGLRSKFRPRPGLDYVIEVSALAMQRSECMFFLRERTFISCQYVTRELFHEHIRKLHPADRRQPRHRP